ncbi:MAG: hypothetical protein WC766_06275 [Patescibacteria group bacterium]|jgi:hypothetical protein
MNLFENLFFVAFAAFTAGMFPVLLHRFGVFKAVGKTKWGERVSEFFGSKEPTIFVKNAFQILAFAYLANMFFTGLTNYAFIGQAWEPIISTINSCNGTVTITQGVSHCAPSLGLNFSSTLPFPSFTP